MHSYRTVHGAKVYTTKKLSHCPNGQAGVCIDEHGGIALISYTTTVIEIDPQGWLVCHGTYSTTTAKHIRAFCKEYAPNLTYQDCKNAYLSKVAINIHPAEVVAL